MVETVRDASVFSGVPLSQVTETALERTGRPFDELRDYRPFEGLVREHPVRALSALGCAARRGDYPSELWGEIVREWPDNARARATRLFCERLRRLPVETVKDIAHPIGYWMREKLPAIALDDETFALAVLDDLLDRILEGRLKSAESGICETGFAESEVERSRCTVNRALNAPEGHAIRALFIIRDARQHPEVRRMPDEFVAYL